MTTIALFFLPTILKKKKESCVTFRNSLYKQKDDLTCDKLKVHVSLRFHLLKVETGKCLIQKKINQQCGHRQISLIWCLQGEMTYNQLQQCFEKYFPPTSFPSSFSNNNQSSVSGGASISVPTIPVTASLPSVSAGHGSSTASGGFNELRSSNGSRKARVLYDYDAASSSELSLLADEVSME